MEKQGFVYMMNNRTRTVLYVGVTSDLERRVYAHKHKLAEGFTKRYNCVDLVWWVDSGSINSAIAREKQIKAGSRRKKVLLVEAVNSAWVDLSVELFGW